MDTVLHVLGLICLDLEEFEEAQKYLQSCFASRIEILGVKDERTMGAHLWVAMAARLVGNLQDAKEILEAAEESILGKWLINSFLLITKKHCKGMHYIKLRCAVCGHAMF